MEAALNVSRNCRMPDLFLPNTILRLPSYKHLPPVRQCPLPSLPLHPSYSITAALLAIPSHPPSHLHIHSYTFRYSLRTCPFWSIKNMIPLKDFKRLRASLNSSLSIIFKGSTIPLLFSPICCILPLRTSHPRPSIST